MPIPPLDSRGLLPPGKHTTNLNDFRSAFAHNPRRDALYCKFEAFVKQEMLPIATGYPLVIGGSYLTDKPYPGDVEATLIIEPIQLGKNQKLILMLSNINELHSTFKKEYEVDFYPSIVGAGNRFDAFFQYVGPKTASMKGLDPKDTRGVLEVIL